MALFRTSDWVPLEVECDAKLTLPFLSLSPLLAHLDKEIASEKVEQKATTLSLRLDAGLTFVLFKLPSKP